jgi:hypothetical protein
MTAPSMRACTSDICICPRFLVWLFKRVGADPFDLPHDRRVQAQFVVLQRIRCYVINSVNEHLGEREDNYGSHLW